MTPGEAMNVMVADQLMLWSMMLWWTIKEEF
jgi:hypothetical protein